MLRTVVVAASLVLCAAANAGEHIGQVHRIVVRDGLYAFYLFETPSPYGSRGLPPIGKPACAFHPYWVVDQAGPAAADFKRIVELAWRDRVLLRVTGTGGCTVWPDGETVRQIEDLSKCSIVPDGTTAGYTINCSPL